MRSWWLTMAGLVGLVQGAAAADWADAPVLRGGFMDGPPRVVNWQGIYVGGQGGLGSSDANFTTANTGITQQLLANTTIENDMKISSWPVLGKKSAQGNGFGGFIGYNSQWDDVVLGVEANYMHASFRNSASGVMTRGFATSDGASHIVQYEPSGSINIRDFGSVRGRAGYAFGSFLPYMFGGVSMGMADISRTSTVYDCADSCLQNPTLSNAVRLSRTVLQNSHFIYGYAGGLGIDVMLMRGLFLRAEWEYLKFAAPIDTSVSTVRAGLGYKF